MPGRSAAIRRPFTPKAGRRVGWWKMRALLIHHFGDTGKVEAQKMLERKAYENKRLLGSFNEECDNWLVVIAVGWGKQKAHDDTSETDDGVQLKPEIL